MILAFVAGLLFGFAIGVALDWLVLHGREEYEDAWNTTGSANSWGYSGEVHYFWPEHADPEYWISKSDETEWRDEP